MIGIGNERYINLVCIICNDLLSYGKLQLILLITILLSALLVITTTSYTRQLTNNIEKLFIIQKELDIDWHNLILEDNIFIDYNCIEFLANENLNMLHLDL